MPFVRKTLILRDFLYAITWPLSEHISRNLVFGDLYDNIWG